MPILLRNSLQGISQAQGVRGMTYSVEVLDAIEQIRRLDAAKLKAKMLKKENRKLRKLIKSINKGKKE